MFSVISTTYPSSVVIVDGVPNYRYVFSDGSTGLYSQADSIEYVDTKNKLEQARENSQPSIKLPVKIPKVNLSTGAGVPGGFSASSLKNPIDVIKSHTAGLDEITSQSKVLDTYINTAKSKGITLSPEIKNQIAAYSLKLSTLKSKLTSQISSVTAHVPNFSVPHVVVPSLPPLPAIPTLPSIPSLPPLPVVSTPIPVKIL